MATTYEKSIYIRFEVFRHAISYVSNDAGRSRDTSGWTSPSDTKAIVRIVLAIYDNEEDQ